MGLTEEVRWGHSATDKEEDISVDNFFHFQFESKIVFYISKEHKNELLILGLYCIYNFKLTIFRNFFKMMKKKSSTCVMTTKVLNSWELFLLGT